MKILIVEDSIELTDLLMRGLKQEKYLVVVAHDGADGLQKAVGDQCDLILLDWMMPRMDGITFIKSFRESNVNIPILMLTAKDSPGDIVQALDAGADDYIAKPFDFNEILARIRSLLRRSTTNEIILSCDSLVLDPKKKIVKRSEKIISLSAKEYRLLEYLMRHKDEVVSEEDIITHGWSNDYEGFSNIVSVYIRYLRNKVDRAFPTEISLIHTVRGMGYSLDDKRKDE